MLILLQVSRVGIFGLFFNDSNDCDLVDKFFIMLPLRPDNAKYIKPAIIEDSIKSRELYRLRTTLISSLPTVSSSRIFEILLLFLKVI